MCVCVCVSYTACDMQLGLAVMCVLVSGAGVYKELWPHHPVVVDLSGVDELRTVQQGQQGVYLGAAVTIQQLIDILRSPPSPAAAAPEGASLNHAGGAASAADHHCRSSDQQCHDDSSCWSRGAAAAPSSTHIMWSAMADHLERIAGQCAELGCCWAHCGAAFIPKAAAMLS